MKRIKATLLSVFALTLIFTFSPMASAYGTYAYVDATQPYTNFYGYVTGTHKNATIRLETDGAVRVYLRLVGAPVPGLEAPFFETYDGGGSRNGTQYMKANNDYQIIVVRTSGTYAKVYMSSQ